MVKLTSSVKFCHPDGIHSETRDHPSGASVHACLDQVTYFSLPSLRATIHSMYCNVVDGEDESKIYPFNKPFDEQPPSQK